METAHPVSCTNDLEVVSLQSLSLVVFAASCCIEKQVVDGVVECFICIAADHHILISGKILYCLLDVEGVLCSLSLRLCFL